MNPLDELVERLDGSVCLTEPISMEAYRRDEAHLVKAGKSLAVLLATSTKDVSTALKWASTHKIPVVTRGGGSGLSGGCSAIDGCLIVSTARMTTIHEINSEDQFAVVDAGVINADVGRAVAGAGLMYAPDPSSYEISTIGGNVATNAGGLRCVKYGVTRDSILALEVVLADGRIISTGHRTVKGVAGYDLTSLFVGSEGTLGIVTKATLKLHPLPLNTPATLVGSFPSLQAAGAAVAAVVKAGRKPSLLELIDQATLRAIDDWKHLGLDDDAVAMLIAQADGTDADAVVEAMQADFEKCDANFTAVSSDPQEVKQLIEVRRLAYPAAERLGRCLVEDVGVPRSKLPQMLARIEAVALAHDVTILTVAHAGDGNIHPTFVFKPQADGGAPAEVWAAADEIFRTALELGGTLTGEHGVGALKQRWLSLELGNDVLDVHTSIKKALDPLGILNPGKGF